MTDDTKVSRRGLLALLGLGSAAVAVASKAEALDTRTAIEKERDDYLASPHEDSIVQTVAAHDPNPATIEDIERMLHSHYPFVRNYRCAGAYRYGDPFRDTLDSCCSIAPPDDWATDALEDYLETHREIAYGKGLAFRERVEDELMRRRAIESASTYPRVRVKSNNVLGGTVTKEYRAAYFFWQGDAVAMREDGMAVHPWAEYADAPIVGVCIEYVPCAPTRPINDDGKPLIGTVKSVSDDGTAWVRVGGKAECENASKHGRATFFDRELYDDVTLFAESHPPHQMTMPRFMEACGFPFAEYANDEDEE